MPLHGTWGCPAPWGTGLMVALDVDAPISQCGFSLNGILSCDTPTVSETERKERFYGRFYGLHSSWDGDLCCHY